MTGIYKIETAKVDNFIKTQIIRNIIIFSLILFAIIIYTLIESNIEIALIVGVSIGIIILIGSSIGISIQNKNKHFYDSFELEILEDKIVRKENGFNKIELKYEEIGCVFMTSKFLIVLKKGLDSNMTYYSRRALTINDYNPIVIPEILEHFEKVSSFLEQKMNNYKN